MSNTNNIDRRGFVKVILTLVGSVMGAVVGLPAIGYLISPAAKTQKSEARISLGLLENYPVGQPTLFSFTRSKVNGWEKTVNSYGVYVTRDDGDQVKVLSNKCTHLSCRVSWKEDRSEYVCPCHDAQFAIDGRVVGGPPPAPLNEYQAEIEDGTIFIQFTEG